MKNWILPIFFFLATVALSFFWGHSRGLSACKQNVKVDTVTVYDSAVVAIPGLIDTIYTDRPIYKPLKLSSEDSAAIFKAFFDSTRFAASATSQQVKVRAKGWVWQNRLDSITFQIQNLRPVQHITNTYSSKSRSLSLGIMAGNQVTAPMAIYEHNRWHFMAAWNLNNHQPGLIAGISYSIYDR